MSPAGRTYTFIDVTIASEPIFTRSFQLDIAEPTPLRSLSFDHGSAFGVSLDSRLVFLTVHDGGDLSVAGEVRQLSGGLYGKLLPVPGGFATISSDTRMLHFYSTANPDKPELVWSRARELGYPSMDVEGNYFYVSIHRSGILIMDITDIRSPIEIGYIDRSGVGSMREMDVKSNLLASNTQNWRLELFDVSDPTTPVTLGTYDDSKMGLAPSVVLVEGAIYYTNGLQLNAVDITDPYNLVPSPYNAYGVRGPMLTKGTRLYASNFEGHTILSITDPWAPTPVGILRNHAPIEVDGYTMLTSFRGSEGDIDEGFAVVDVRDPAHPRVMGEVAFEENAQDFAYTDQRFYALTHSGEIEIFTVSDCDPCAADYNEDGRLNFLDIVAFLGDYPGQPWKTDLDQNGIWNYFDISVLLHAFQSGCSN